MNNLARLKVIENIVFLLFHILSSCSLHSRRTREPFVIDRISNEICLNFRPPHNWQWSESLSSPILLLFLPLTNSFLNHGTVYGFSDTFSERVCWLRHVC